MGKLDKQVAIITGAGSGIGKAIARSYAENGAAVALVGRRPEKLEEAAASTGSAQTFCLPCDISDRDAVNRMGEAVIERFGRVDILVNNAGINTNPRSVADVVPEDWDRTISINLTGAFNCVRAVLPQMRRQQKGLVINISSIAGKRAGTVAGAAYCASKHGMVALTHTISAEEQGHGIRASVICPGEVETPILDLRVQPVSDEHRARILQPEDVAEAALFIASLPSRVAVPELIVKPATQGYR